MTKVIILLSILGALSVGCSKDDGLETAAAPTTSTEHMPEPVNNPNKQKLPPLGAPGASGGAQSNF